MIAEVVSGYSLPPVDVRLVVPFHERVEGIETVMIRWPALSRRLHLHIDHHL